MQVARNGTDAIKDIINESWKRIINMAGMTEVDRSDAFQSTVPHVVDRKVKALKAILLQSLTEKLGGGTASAFNSEYLLDRVFGNLSYRDVPPDKKNEPIYFIEAINLAVLVETLKSVSVLKPVEILYDTFRDIVSNGKVWMTGSQVLRDWDSVPEEWDQKQSLNRGQTILQEAFEAMTINWPLLWDNVLGNDGTESWLVQRYVFLADQWNFWNIDLHPTNVSARSSYLEQLNYTLISDILGQVVLVSG